MKFEPKLKDAKNSRKPISCSLVLLIFVTVIKLNKNRDVSVIRILKSILSSFPLEALEYFQKSYMFYVKHLNIFD